MNLKNIVPAAAGMLLLFTSNLVCAQAPNVPGAAGGPPPTPPPALRIERDVEYAKIGNRALHLDLYLRDTADKKALPVVVWVHSGDWLTGDKTPTPAARLVANGYAVASVEYRLASDAKFPAQLNDLKAAVRWLRANAQKYNLDGAHIGAWGASAGGHLVSLLGTTGDVKELEGNEGNLDQSSRVQAVVDVYGAIDLMRLDKTATQPKSNAADLPEAILLGGPLMQNQDKAKAANPITYITPDDPPFLLVHGASDHAVPARQSEYFQIALKHAEVENTLEYVPGADHNTAQVLTPAVNEMITNFFDKHLRGNQHQRDDLASIREPDDSWIDPFADDLPGTQFKLYDTPTRGPKTQASYRVYLPPGYTLPENAKLNYPVIYYLAGASNDSRSFYNSGYLPRLDAAIRGNLMPPAIVIALQYPNRTAYMNTKDGRSPLETVIVKDLITHVDQTYRTVREREGRAIEGHSMGGQGSLRLGFKFPELFGSISALSAALVTTTPGMGGIPAVLFEQQYGSDQAYFDAQTPWTWVEANADKLRGHTYIRLISGSADILTERSKRMSDTLTRLNIAHQFIESPNAPHDLKEVLSRLDNNPFEFYAKVFAKYNVPKNP